MKYLIKNGNIVLENKTLQNHLLLVNNHIIIDIIEPGLTTPSAFDSYEIIDAAGGYITPGLIEMHIHGCGPYDFASIPSDFFEKAEAFLHERGINTFLPTFQYNPKYLKNLLYALGTQKALKNSIHGYYLEGPFINKDKRGGILEENISSADFKLLDEIILNSHGLLKIMTIAPEIKDAEFIVRYLIDNNIVPALGHSSCTIADIKTLEKYSSKLNITHLYNAMSGISHKQSGLAMFPFLYKDSFFELNGDSIHLSDEIIKMSYEHLNHDKLILISDAVISAGGDFGEGGYCGIPVVSDDTGVRYKENGTLIGSNKLLPEIIVNFMRVTGAPVYEAVKFATINPARLLGLDSSLGSIKIGKASDLVIFDGDFRVKRNLKGY